MLKLAFPRFSPHHLTPTNSWDSWQHGFPLALGKETLRDQRIRFCEYNPLKITKYSDFWNLKFNFNFHLTRGRISLPGAQYTVYRKETQREKISDQLMIGKLWCQIYIQLRPKHSERWSGNDRYETAFSQQISPNELIFWRASLTVKATLRAKWHTEWLCQRINLEGRHTTRMKMTTAMVTRSPARCPLISRECD